MKVTVRSKSEAADLLACEPEKFSVLVSIHCKGNTPLTEQDSEPVEGFHDFPRPKLELVFDDAEEPSVVRMGYSPPRREDVERLLDWYSKLTLGVEDTMLIHCAAGVSRSTACALTIYVQSGGCGLGAVHDSLESVKLDRPQLWPNMLIIQHADDILGLNGEFVNVIGDWKKSQGGRLFSPEV